MKKFFTTIIFFTISLLSFAQKKEVLPPIVKEDVDIKALYDEYSKTTEGETYFFYRLMNHIPLTTKSIDNIKPIANFDWETFTNQKDIPYLRIFKDINKTLVLRSPLEGEDRGFLYFECVVGSYVKYPLLDSQMKVKLNEVVKNNVMFSETDPIPNFVNLSFKFRNEFSEKKRKPLELGNEAIVTIKNMDEKSVKVTIAIPIANCTYDDITNGYITASCSRYNYITRCSISKNRIGKNISTPNVSIDLLEYDNGVIHLSVNSRDNINDFQDRVIVGEKDKKMYIISTQATQILTPLYNIYRQNPNKDYKDFLKLSEKIMGKTSLMNNLNNKILIYNLDYDFDVVHFVQTTELNNNDWAYSATINKNKEVEERYRIFPTSGSSRDDNRQTVNEIRNFLSSVKHPLQEYAGGIAVEIFFVITKEGRLMDLEVKGERLDIKYVSTIMASMKNAPKFKPITFNGVPITFKGRSRLIFK